MEPRKALGRGLAALIPDLVSPAPSSLAGTAKDLHPKTSSASSADLSTAPREFFHCPIENIAPSPDNPRHFYDEQKMIELGDSISAQGLIQPLVVRKRHPNEALAKQVQFVLIAGERRWRAAQRAGVLEVPVVCKDVDRQAAFELALVENVQREDLNAIEEAEGYKRLSSEFGYTQEQLADRVGRSRESVANMMRLLRLSLPIQEMVVRSEISAGHARALLGLEDPTAAEQLARQIGLKQLSVRQTEEWIRRYKRKSTFSPSRQTGKKTTSLLALEQQIQDRIGSHVRLVSKSAHSGRIEIEYQSIEEFERILSHLLQKNSPPKR